jgi:branched-subunit amino acid transport protein
MNEWLVILGMMLVTFLPRYGTLAILGRVEMPKAVFGALKFVPPAVLSAIILPAMVLKDGQFHIALDNSYLMAGVFSAVVAWRTRNLMLTIVLGMGAFLIYRAVVGGLIPPI